jgi:hypothetical protein
MAVAWLWVLVGCSGWLGGNRLRVAGSGLSDGREVVVGIGIAVIFGNLRVAVIVRGGGCGWRLRCDELVWSGPMA